MVKINNFVATLDELLRFLDSYQEDLFYFDINASVPPVGARRFDITTFPADIAERVISEIHPGAPAPRLTPEAKAKIEASRPQAGKIACGINIHPKNGQGWPTVHSDMAKVGWIRFPFMSSAAQFPSLDAAFNFFDPVINAYNTLGVKILLVLTHETYGEATGINWNQMDSQKWASFAINFVTVVERIVQHYGNRVQGYEIWNEGDAKPNNPAAVYFPPADYAPLLDRAETAIRAHAADASVILGGLIGGPSVSIPYVKTIQKTLGGRLPVDAIGYHPYGKGAPGDKTIFARNGSVGTDIERFQEAFPHVPLWITEIGAQGTDDPNYWDDAASYLTSLYGYIRSHQAHNAPVVMWYAWSDAMDRAQKTNGLLKLDNTKKPFLYDAFFNEACKDK